MKYKINAVVAFALLLALVSCHRTNKNVLSEAYHNLTAHYNSEWNANDKLRTVLNNVNKNPGDNYDSILSIKAFENLLTTSTYSGDYDLIVKKSTFSIQQHPSSKWSDNNFYLMGMAHFMKGDYPKAIDHFQYITSELKNGYLEEYLDKTKLKKTNAKIKSKISKKKAKIKKQKKKGKTVDESSLRPHEKALGSHPSRNPALIMLILAYTKNFDYDKASSVISYIEADSKFPDNYLADFYLAKATFYVEQGKFENAIIPLKQGLTALKKKSTKDRPSFVLAQLYQAINQNTEAVKEYENTLKYHPNYSMEFNAKLNIAIITADGDGNAKKAKDILTKMSKDGKNTDMLDQIYYHLGKIAYKEHNNEEAIADYRKSLAKNKANVQQKALTYVALADLYYFDEEYKSAKVYYDSALVALSKKATNFNQVKDRDDRLTRLVAQMDIIDVQDSLQALAELPDADRKKKLKEIINALIKNKENKTKVEGTSTVNKTDIGDNGNSSFYFYNQAARNKGYSNFKKIWGDIKLADNWRRQDKSSSSGSADNAADTASDNASASSDYRDELKKLQDQLPISKEQRKISDDKKLDAYYLLANIYKDDFNDVEKSAETFELILKKYPDNKYEAECYYNLYLLYAKRNPTKAEEYKQLVLTKFPSSLMALAINDPDFLKKQKTKSQEIEDDYTLAYTLYTNANYEQSLLKCKEGVTKYRGDKIEAKFAYLSVLNVGKQKKYEDFGLALASFMKMYSTDPLKDEAEKMLLYMSNISEYIKQDSAYNYSKTQVKVIDVVDKVEVKDIVIAKDTSKAATSDPKVIIAPGIKTDSTKAKKDTVIVATSTVDNMPDGMDLSKFNRDSMGIHRILIFPSNPDLASIELINKIKEFDNLKPINKKLIVGNLLVNATTKLITIKEFSKELDALAYYNDLLKSDAFKGLNLSDYRVMVTTAKNQSVAVGNGLLENLYWFFKTTYLKK